MRLFSSHSVLLLLVAVGACADERADEPWEQFSRPVVRRTDEKTTPAAKTYGYVGRGAVVPVNRTDFLQSNGFALPTPEMIEALQVAPLWRPLRNFGPFVSGSDFEQIRIGILRTAEAGTWYFNNFAASLDPAVRPVYDLYWNNSIPTSSSAAVILHNTMLLSLKRFEYSSRYGGTVSLVFRFAEFQGYQGPWTPGTSSLPDDSVFHQEEFGYDLETFTYRFDVRDLELRFFVPLTPASFNPTTPFFGDESIFVEARAEDVTAYEKSGGPRITEEAALSAAMTELESRLAALESNFALPGTRRSAVRLTYAFIHDQFNAEFNQGGSTIPRKVQPPLVQRQVLFPMDDN